MSKCGAQLACSARRFAGAGEDLAIVRALLHPRWRTPPIRAVPLLLWWAIEAKADIPIARLFWRRFGTRPLWELPIVKQHCASIA